MLLTIDVGNTHTVTGLFEAERLLGHWRLRSDRDVTADELALSHRGLLELAGVQFGQVDGCVIASVVPVLENTWLDCIRRYLAPGLGSAPLVVDCDCDSGIVVDTDSPREVGADRIVNAAAAWHRLGRPAIVIDFGTAITFDCVAEPGRYVGGAILPGIGISLDALASRTAKLPRVDVSTPPSRVIGRDTVSAIHSGILHGYGGLVDRLCARLGEELCHDSEFPRPAIIATGGMAGLITPFCEAIERVEPMLTIEGLRLIHQRNRNS